MKRSYVSITGKTYDRLAAYAIKHRCSITSIIEQAVAPTLGLDAPVPRKSYRLKSRT